MKQTNNAIKFLMAQYRAIFKNAYFKGMATALVLTAGLAAGAAQAADEIYYSDDGKTWTTTSGSGRIAGAVAGVHLSPATEGTTAANGKLNITSTWSGSGSIYGGYVDTTKLDSGKDVDVSAVGNTLTVNGDTGKVSNSGSNVVGGWAKTQNGFALASDNKVIVNVDNSNTTDDSQTLQSGGQVIGAWASSLNGATAQNNTVELSGNNKSGDTYLHLGNGAFGAMAFVDANATGGDFVAQGNTLDVTYTSSTNDNATTHPSGLWLIGGYAYTNGSAGSGSGSADSLQAIGNSIIADHVTIGKASGSGAGLVAGNLAVNNLSGSIADVVANGNGQATLTISNSTFYHTSVFGGQAVNYAGGSATANANTVNITDSDFFANTSGNNAIFGGQASTTLTSGDQTATLDASSNVVSITNTKADKSTRSVLGSIYGAQIKVASGSGSNLTDFVGSTLTANNNSVTVGEGITVSSGSVYGAYIASDGANVASGGATINASNNSVTFNGTFTGGADTVIAGVVAEPGIATMNNNHVTINGKVSGVSFIYGAFASKQGKIDDKIDNPQHNLNNNSITIGSKAEVTGAKIWAAGSAETSALTFNNDVTIEGTVKNSDVYGGTGADSAITLAAGGTLTYTNDKATDSVLRSDVVNLAGTVNVGTNDTLKISGFVHNGNQNATSYNTNETNIASSATIYNRNTVELLGDTTVANGAKLHALSAGAKILVNGDVSGSTIDDTLDPKNDIDFDMVGGRGSLNISAADLKSYLTAGDAYTLGNVSSTDKAGTVDLASGGVLNFADNSVVISDFDYSTTDAPGKITVETDTTSGGSVIKGNELTIAHKFAQNATVAETYKDLQAVSATGIKVDANTLNLGSSTLSSTQSENLYFKQAKARDEINFVAMTSGADVEEIGTNAAGRNDGYHLVSEVVGSHYMLTSTQDNKLQYYTAQSGVVNGPVTITESDKGTGNLWIQNGNWTANGQITLASGGTLTVGDDDGITPPAGVDASGPDATLTLNQALVLDLTTTNGGDSNIVVSGSGNLQNTLDYADELDGTVSAETARVALLDLRNGLTMQGTTTGNKTTYNGKAVFNVTHDGIVLLSADDVNTILAQNDSDSITDRASGTFFTADNGGAFIVDGDIVADFGDFNNTGTTNGFYLGTGDSAGILAANKITVEHANETSGEHNDKAYIEKSQGLNIAGNLYVADLEINDLQLTNGGKDGKDKPSDAGNYASVVKIANGTAHISKSLTSVNQTLALQNDSRLVFDTDAVKDKGTVAVDVLRADGATSNITFENGEWTANAINLSGAGSSLTVGDGNRDREDINGNETYTTLDATSLTMAKDTKAHIYADGTANFKTADLSALAGAADYNNAAIQVEGELSISDSVKFGKEGSIALEKNGVLKLGNKAVNESIIKDGTYTTGTVSLISGSTFTKIRNDRGGELYLDLGANTVFGGDQVKAFKQLLFTSDSFADGVLVHGGVLNIGKATFQGVKVEELVGPGLSGYTATWDSLKGFSDIFGEDVTNDTLVQTNVSDIKPGDNIQGHWGSLSMEKGVADSAQVQIAGNTSLNFAATTASSSAMLTTARP